MWNRTTISNRSLVRPQQQYLKFGGLIHKCDFISATCTFAADMQPLKRRWWITPVILLYSIIVLHVLALQPAWIEKIYSISIYPVVSAALRIFTCWLPFSIGDVLYLCLVIWLLFKIIQFLRRKPSWKKFAIAFKNFFVKFLWLYLIFLLIWGLNYYRYGIGYQTHLIPESYSTNDLKDVTSELLIKLNESRKLLDSEHYASPDKKTILQQAAAEYDNAEVLYPYLVYRHKDIKEMLSGIAGNYAGFLGYYNPFTGEAQVNSAVPDFIIPFTACHEIAHQIGYASESEASFIGYLVVHTGSSMAFKYSAYFDLFGFANAELYQDDSAAAKQNVQLLDTLVKKDYVIYRKYLEDYKNPVGPLLSKLYGSYLKVHNQPKGIQSYNEVIAWIVAYYKKYGAL